FANFSRTVEHIGQAQLVARQNALCLGFEQRRRKPRQNWRHSSQQLLVDHGGLREVRDFRRSSGVNERRQQVILHHGTKQHVRTEFFGSLFNLVNQFFGRAPLLTDGELTAVDAIISAMHYRTTSILHLKKQRGRRSHFHLQVISRRFERLAPPKQRLIEFGGPFDRRAEQGFCEIVEI